MATTQLVYTVVDRPSRQRRILLLPFVLSLTVFIAGLIVLIGL